MQAASIAVIALVACAGAPSSKQEVAEPLPALELPLIDGGTWSSASARGRAMVIDVWASWCEPCSKGFPKLEALAARHITVVAISIDEDPAAIRAFLARFPLAVPVAHDSKQVLTGKPLAIGSLPTLLVVDANGIVRHRFDKATERDYERLDELVTAP